MIFSLWLVLLSQNTNVIIQNPTNPTKRVTTTTSGAKELLDVNCPGCSGGGGSVGDGGYTIVIQGPGADGGAAWGVSLADPRGQATMAKSVPVVVASDQTAVPVSGTVTANAGANLNTSALALDATLTNRAQKTQLTDGTRDGTIKAASTAAVAGDTSVVVALSPNSPLPAGSAVIGHVVADTGSTTAVTGNVTVVQSTGTNLHAVLDTTSTTAVTQGTASNLNAQVQGAAASGATKAGNPVQVGGVFNTTQPTVTSGQAAEAQSTARGALIVASGVDAINVAATGTVTANQGGAPWTVTGTKTNNNAAPGATNVGVLGAVANAASQTWTEGDLVALSEDLSGRLRTDTTSWLGSTAPTVGQKTTAASIPVTMASNQGAMLVEVAVIDSAQPVSNTGGTMNRDGLGVSVGTTSTTCLAADPSRQGCSVCLAIDATDYVHVRFSATAATTSYQKLAPGQCAYCNLGNRVYEDVITCIAASGTQTVYAADID